jgi:hypothetical protein
VTRQPRRTKLLFLGCELSATHQEWMDRFQKIVFFLSVESISRVISKISPFANPHTAEEYRSACFASLGRSF